MRNADNVQHRDITFSSLNLTDIRIVEACLCRHVLVGQPLLLAGMAQSRPKELEQHGLLALWRKRPRGRGSFSLPRTPGVEGITGEGKRKGGASVERGNEPGRRNRQGTRKTEQREHGNIAFTCFDLADIRTAYARPGSECWLGQSPLLPILTEEGSKAL